MKFAFFSCQDYTFGYYNAHALLAREDVDFVVNLGDYIYAEAYHSPANPNRAACAPTGSAWPPSLPDYRAKYELYRSEDNLRRMHAKFPMISIWDDHEVQDNYAGGAGPRAGCRREALQPGPQARGVQGLLREHAHVRPGKPQGQPHLRRGALRPQRGPGAAWTSASTAPTSRAATSRSARPCPELEQPRDFLGDKQMNFVKKRLAARPRPPGR